MTLELKYTLSDEAVEGICTERQYQATVPNPDKPGETMDNPVTPEVFVYQAGYEFLSAQAAGGKKRQRDETRRTEDAADKESVKLPKGTVLKDGAEVAIADVAGIT